MVFIQQQKKRQFACDAINKVLNADWRNELTNIYLVQSLCMSRQIKIAC